jgi:hypothetical protein
MTSYILLCGLQTVAYVGSVIERKSALGLCGVSIPESPEPLPASCRHSGIIAATHLFARILRGSRRYLELLLRSV